MTGLAIKKRKLISRPMPTKLIIFCSILFTLIAGAETDKPPSGTHISFPIGVTQDNQPIPAWISVEDLDIHSTRKRILLIAGMEGDKSTAILAREALRSFGKSGLFREYSVSAILDANPGGNPVPAFPPEGKAYNDKKNPATIYLWRFIGTHGPDLVIDLRPGDEFSIRMGKRSGGIDKALAKALKAKTNAIPDSGLASALWRNNPAGVGRVPAIQVTSGDKGGNAILEHILTHLKEMPGGLPLSKARAQLQARANRTPIETAHNLAQYYGQNPATQYIPALALVGRLRLAELDNATEHRAAVTSLLQPYANGQKKALGKGVSGVNLSGHLAIAELAFRHKNQALARLVEAAAQRAHESRKNPKDPVSGHNQMSDSVFMVCPILAAAHALTGKAKYLEDCIAHLRYMRKIDLRADGIYRHSPQDETAWGRGNGFPALGLALSLGYLSRDAPGRDEILQAFRTHIAALAKHQDPTGMWHQVIDHPESYREMTSTCMITFAMARGIRMGWLDRKVYDPHVRKSWPAINQRIGTDGHLIDVCTGTGKQKNLRAYLDRTAILGKDSRGGSMALLAATEVAALRLKPNR
jgi:unsaturated rhamnogalacturonyl hydrolase